MFGITPKIKGEIQKQQREFQKHRRSKKWNNLNLKVNEMVKSVKGIYYSNVVKDLKNSNKKEWYSKLKRISSYNIHLQEPTQASNICECTDNKQAERIADTFLKISQEYDALKFSDIVVPPFTKE